MDAMAYLSEAREKYLAAYRGAIRKRRAADPSCVPEVWLRPRDAAASDDDDGPALPMCIDILSSRTPHPDADDESDSADGESGGGRQIISVMTEEAPEGPAVGSLRVGALEVPVFPVAWEICTVWVRHPQPDWSALDAWRSRWMDAERTPPEDEPDGLSGVAHFLSEPNAEGGGWLLEVDFGSAPVEG